MENADSEVYFSEEYEEAAINLLQRVSELQQANDRARLVTGNEFTPFSAKSLAHAPIEIDENMASRILAMLLDPRENHGQGTFFLNKFLGLLSIPEKDLGELENIRVWVEKNTYGADRNRRIDIYLQGEKFLLGIENKLGADDAENQLEDYLKYLETNSRNKCFYLVYLTPDGHHPSNYTLSQEAKDHYKDRYMTMSWATLTESLADSANELPIKIFYFVNDFCNAIKTQKLKIAKKENEMGIINFIMDNATPEMLKAAYAIHNSYNSVAEKTISNWAHQLREKVKYESKLNFTSIVKDDIIPETPDGKLYKEIDYLIANYDEMKVSYLVFCPDGKFADFKPKAIIYGLQLWPSAQNSEDQFILGWKEHLMKIFGKDRLTGNMITCESVYTKYDPDFLAILKSDAQPPYLYDTVVNECSKLEKIFAEYKNSYSQRT